jgi:hypothetical protein
MRLKLHPPNLTCNGPAAQVVAQPGATADQRPVLEPLTYDTDDLAFVLRSSLATIHRLRAAGKLPRALKLGGQLRWRVDEVKAWCAAGMPDLKTWEAMRSIL